MGSTGCLNLQQKIDHLLMLGQSLLGREFEHLLEERHIEASFVSGPPVWTGVRRQMILTIHLR